MASIRARLEAASRSSSDDDDSNSLAPYAAFNSLPTEDSLEQLRRKTTYINGDPGYYERPNSDVEEKAARLGMAKSHCCKCVDITATVAVILVIWIMMAAPTVLYMRRLVHTRTQVSSANTTTSSDNATCTLYNATSSRCTEHILHFVGCLQDLDASHDKIVVYVSGSPNQQELETTLSILDGYPGASEQCLLTIKPLICLHYINICSNKTGVVIKPSVSQCEHVEKVCSKELEMIRMIEFYSQVVDQYLTTCVPSSPLDNRTCDETNFQNSSLDIRCSKGFYETANGTCQPECGVWTPYSDETVMVTDALTVSAAVIAVVSSITVLILSYVYRQKIYRYPVIFIIYETILALSLPVLFLIAISRRKNLFCRSRDLIESILHPTHFCIITGVVFYYVVLQLLLWWLWHTIAVFWAVTWPFHARKFNTSRNTKYLHIAFVLASVVLPVVPVLLILFVSTTHGRKMGGFTVTRFPPFFCTGFDVHVNFWTYLFPITLILAAGVALLILILRTVIKKHLLSKLYKIRTNLNRTLELKVVLVLCYFVLIGTVVLSVFTYALVHIPVFVDSFTALTGCERAGLPPNATVSKCTKHLNKIHDVILPYATTVAIVVFSLLPAVNLLYVVNFKELRKKLRCHHSTRQAPMPVQNDSKCSHYVPYVVNKEPINTSQQESFSVLMNTTKTDSLFHSQKNNDLRQ